MSRKDWQRLCLAGRLAGGVGAAIVIAMLCLSALWGTLWYLDGESLQQGNAQAARADLERRASLYAALALQPGSDWTALGAVFASDADLLEVRLVAPPHVPLSWHGGPRSAESFSERVAVSTQTQAGRVEVVLSNAQARREQARLDHARRVRLAWGLAATLLLALLLVDAAALWALSLGFKVSATLNAVRARLDDLSARRPGEALRLDSGPPELRWLAVAVHRAQRAWVKERHAREAASIKSSLTP